jgi:hypothetical protein
MSDNRSVEDAVNSTKGQVEELLGIIPGLENAINTHNKEVRFFCIEPVVVKVSDVEHHCEANQVATIFVGDEDFEIIPTSNESIQTLLAYPKPLTWYDWLEGVDSFSGIVFDMNELDTYKHWIQYYQDEYHVQKAQYSNCIFWSDKPYTHSPFEERTNYTLYYSAELPLCFSRIPANTYKPFYLAYGVKTDPNWNNPDYIDSYSNVSGATQTFSYYGMSAIGIFDMTVHPIKLPKDCRGLMYHAPAIQHAGVFDAVNATNFGAKKGSWQEAFGDCISLTSLYIQNLKASINVSWSPINAKSIAFIVNNAANTSAITISVSPYTWYRLSDEIKTAASAKNITIALLTGNYQDDSRWNNKVDSDSLATVATSGSYNDLSDKPTIPTEVTESTVSGWGFTKNEGTVTNVKLNGTTYTPTDGLVDLGTIESGGGNNVYPYIYETLDWKKTTDIHINSSTYYAYLIGDQSNPYNFTIHLDDYEDDNAKEYIIELGQVPEGSTLSIPGVWANENPPVFDGATIIIYIFKDIAMWTKY